MSHFHFHSTTQILENVAIDSDLAKGRRYFEGSVKFMRTLQEVLDMLIDSVSYSRRSFKYVTDHFWSFTDSWSYLDCVLKEHNFYLQVNSLTADKLHESFMKQMWGVATLCLVIIICPLLGLLSKNAIASIQVNWQMYQNTSAANGNTRIFFDICVFIIQLFYRFLP